MSVSSARAQAKLNLALAVLGRRDDGYHALRSVFLRLDLHDTLEVEQLPDVTAIDELEIAGAADTPLRGNLVLAATHELRRLVDQPLPGLRLRLTKRIPAAAGLAGGSSDAAAAMDLAASMWGLRLHPTERLSAALRLGADVPFFAAGHPAAIVHGVGEGLRPLPAPVPPAGLLLVTPAARLSTAAVFAELDRVEHDPDASRAAVDELAGALSSGLDGEALADLAPRLRDANDLWQPAVRLSSQLAATRAALESVTGRPFMLTGSGPTLFAIYASPPEAAAAAEELLALRERGERRLDGAVIVATSSSVATGSSVAMSSSEEGTP